MRKQPILIFLAFCFAYSSAGAAVNRQDFQVILVPLSFEVEKDGAFGSLWSTEIWLRNLGVTPLPFAQGPPDCRIICPDGPLFTLPAQKTIRWRNDISHRLVPGVLLYVEKARADELAISLRIRDTSRSLAEGTEIPVVREPALLPRRITLLNVPIGGDSRSHLRIYDATNAPDTVVRIRLIAEEDDVLLREMVVLLERGMTAIAAFSPFPSFAEIQNLGDVLPLLQEVTPSQRIRIEIESLVGDRQLWAFASVTHNETQFVTVVSPQ
jgi:hypothetical protein